MNIALFLENPSLILQVLLIGISNGAVLALVALGYTMVYGIIELINFAHGDVFMLGTMMALTLIVALGLTPSMPVAALIPLLGVCLAGSMASTAALNIAIERFAYRPLRRAPRLAPLITAIGVSFILMNVGLHWKGASYVTFPALVPEIDLFRTVGLQTAVSLTVKDLFVIGLTIPLLLGLNWFVQHTRLGKAMRATAQDREAALLMGIDINLTIALTFLLAGALAGAGGFIQGLYYQSARFDLGFRAGLLAFTSAVVGGIGNLTGAVAGALLIGLIAAFSDFVLDPKWTLVVVFGILILVMVFRPSGILGEQTPDRA